MEKEKNPKLGNLLFYGMIALLVLFVCVSSLINSKSEDLTPLEAETPQLTDTPSPSEMPLPQKGITEDALRLRLEQTDLRISEGKAAHMLYLRDPDRAGRIPFQYSVTDGRVIAFSFELPLLPEPTPTPKPKERPTKELQELIAKQAEKESSAHHQQLKKLILLLTPLLLPDSEVPEMISLRLYDGAVDVKKQGDRFSDRYEGLSFLATATVEGNEAKLRLSFLLQ